MAKFNKLGQEVPDSTPLAVPLGSRKPESITEMMRRLIRQDMSRHFEKQGHESFEEANDFEVEDEDAELSNTEYETMADEVPRSAQAPKEAHDEDEDEEEKPRRKKKSYARRQAEEEDEEEERPRRSRHERDDDDEAEHDEVPRKKKKGRAARPSSRTRVSQSDEDSEDSED